MQLIQDIEFAFLENYGREIFDDMIDAEFKAQFSSLMSNQMQITR